VRLIPTLVRRALADRFTILPVVEASSLLPSITAFCERTNWIVLVAPIEAKTTPFTFKE
jgi:hypothetical protein